jgi:hypothetical protein
MPDPSYPPPARREAVVAWLIFAVAVLFFAWGVSVGWESKRLPGVEYRQAQTALSTYWIKHDRDFSLAYPTPVLGKPWSVPMEFPLYQWTVVATGQLTGLGITKAARVVSITCFVLTWPALFLLLGRWQVAVGRRALVLAVVVSCPLYVFYARAFMIETMALMFALWFWVAFERAVTTRRLAWLAAAMVAGSGAGLVKITTLLLYLLPMAAWVIARWWRGRGDGTVGRDLRWVAAALAVPAVVSAWWIVRADRIKALNPAADFLGSVHMRTFNLGNTELRLSPELWAMKARIVGQELTWAPLFVAVGLLLPWLGGRHRVRAAAGCAAVFAGALVIFPVLYAYHQYYYLASLVVLLVGAGLLIVGVAEAGRWRWLASVAAAVVVAGQAYWYGREVYPQQAGTGEGGTALTRVLRAVTQPGDVIVVAGEDWSSITPYYAQRRALMLRGDTERDGAKLDRAFAELRGETLGAFVVTGEPWEEKTAVLERIAARGFAARPLLEVAGSWLILPREREAGVVEAMRMGQVPEARWAPGAEPPPDLLAGQWHGVAELPRYQRAWFAFMRPVPVRFFTTFEPSLQEMEGESAFNAHPVVRLVFQLPAGEHELATTLWFNPDAYTAGASAQSSDGVEVEVFALESGSATRSLGGQVIDPVQRAADRGEVPVRVRFALAAAGEVEVVVGPGPSGRDTRDWVWLRGPLVIAPVGGGTAAK